MAKDAKGKSHIKEYVLMDGTYRILLNLTISLNSYLKIKMKNIFLEL